MTYDREMEFHHAKDFVEALVESELFRPRTAIDAMLPGAAGYVFRGQPDASQPLLPRAHRPGCQWPNYTPQPPDDEALVSGRILQYLGGHIAAEMLSVHLFLEQADKLGIPTPIDYLTAGLHTDLMNAAFRNDESFDYARQFPDPRDYPRLALAQHHGVPTRLLDWTESPLVAAYFAAGAVDDPKPATGAMSVTCFSTRWIRYSNDSVAKVAAPRYKNAFLRVQRGMFTVMPAANDFFLGNGRWPSLEDVVETWRSNTTTNMIHPILLRLTLPVSESRELLRLLWRYDLTPHHLMPTLGNAAASFAYARKLWSNHPQPPASIEAPD